MDKGDLIYETKPDRGFVFRAWDLPESTGEALIEVERDGKLVREFHFPAYKVYNIAAHSHDIIQSELDQDAEGYWAAGSTGLGGNVFRRSPSHEAGRKEKHK